MPRTASFRLRYGERCQHCQRRNARRSGENFVSRKGALAGQQSIVRQQTAQLNEEIGGLNGLVRAEISDVQSLVRKGLAKRSRLLALQRQQAEIEGAQPQYRRGREDETADRRNPAAGVRA